MTVRAILTAGPQLRKNAPNSLHRRLLTRRAVDLSPMIPGLPVRQLLMLYVCWKCTVVLAGKAASWYTAVSLSYNRAVQQSVPP